VLRGVDGADADDDVALFDSVRETGEALGQHDFT
jgi:hypothetical protein